MIAEGDLITDEEYRRRKFDTALGIVINQAVQALLKAVAQHPPMRSVHEMIGIIQEEWCEVKAEAFAKVVSRKNLAKELDHLIAMGLRAKIDLGLYRED
jgi:hypothetical protein